jgi:hypothetical protein
MEVPAMNYDELAGELKGIKSTVFGHSGNRGLSDAATVVN